MKKNAKLFLLLGTLLLTSCTTVDSKESPSSEDNQIFNVYQAYQDNGGTLSYEEWLQTIKGEPGPQGEPGRDGRSIESIEKTSSDGNKDTYTITYSDGTTSSFVIVNGIDGENGIQGLPGENGHTPTITIGQNGNWFVDNVDTGVAARGPKGDPGPDGKDGQDGQDGRSIVSITKFSTSGKTDTYRITYSDGSVSYFVVVNGEDGAQGVQGIPGQDGHTPIITIGGNGNWFVDGTDTGVAATGSKGEKGDDGLSAYELYLKYHPEYTGTESEWLEAFMNGDLRGQYTVSFNTNGGSEIPSQIVTYGHFATRPYDDPVRAGYIFDGWYLNSEPFPFNSYPIYEDLRIYARWKSNNLTITLDPDGGEVEYNTKTVTYGVDYTLPTPTRNHYVFDGWYYEDLFLCPISGIWEFSKENITLKARWASTMATVVFESEPNVELSEASAQIPYGQYFSLPVPTITTGDPFIGWATGDGKLVTDGNGESIRKSTFVGTITLHAVYYVEIDTPQKLLSLNSMSEDELDKTFVLVNDLDFSGLENEPINNFRGILNGNGYRILNMTKSLFASVGSPTSSKTKSPVIENLSFVSFGGKAVVECAHDCKKLLLKNITIHSFIKDANNYCPFYGFIKTVGDRPNDLRPEDIVIDSCRIADAFATIVTGFVDYLSFFKNLTITNSFIRSNTTSAAFVAADSLSKKLFFGYEKTTNCDDLLSGDRLNDCLKSLDTSIEIEYCSNWGDSPCWLKCSAGTYAFLRAPSDNNNYYHKTLNNYGKDPIEYNPSDLTKLTVNEIKSCISSAASTFVLPKHSIEISDSVNYGGLSENILSNQLFPLFDYLNHAIFDGSSCPYGLCRIVTEDSVSIRRTLNFGSLPCLIGTQAKRLYGPSIHYAIDRMLNAGATTSQSLNLASSISGAYVFLPLAGVSEPGAYDISLLSQINAEFFEGVLGLDPTIWDLSYIKIDDEYGLPTIIY